MLISLGRIQRSYMKLYTKECKILDIKGEKACEDY